MVSRHSRVSEAPRWFYWAAWGKWDGGIWLLLFPFVYFTSEPCSLLINLWVPTPAKTLAGNLELRRILSSQEGSLPVCKDFPGTAWQHFLWHSCSFQVSWWLGLPLPSVPPFPRVPAEPVSSPNLVLRTPPFCCHNRLVLSASPLGPGFLGRARTTGDVIKMQILVEKCRGRALKFCIFHSLMMLLLLVSQPHQGSRDMKSLFHL